MTARPDRRRRARRAARARLGAARSIEQSIAAAGIAGLRARLPRAPTSPRRAPPPRPPTGASPPAATRRRSPAWRSRSRTCSTSRAQPTARRLDASLADAPPAARDAPGRRAPARGRRRADRPHQHDGVRVLRRRHQSAPRHAGQPGDRARSTRRRAFPAARPPAARSRSPTGAAWAALGSDTGGSIRIPAALQGSSASRARRGWCRSTARCRCRPTLDTVCAMTRSVRDAVAAARGAGRAARSRSPRRPLAALRFAVPRTLHARRPRRRPSRAPSSARLAALAAAGARIETIELPPLGELAAINATGGFAAAESWAWHRTLLAERERRLRPARRAAHPPRRGDERGRLHRPASRARRDWIAAHGSARCSGFDALLSPDRADRRAAASRRCVAERRRLLRRQRAAAAQPVDRQPARRLRALACPATRAGELPVGLMVWARRAARRRRARRRARDRGRARRPRRGDAR